METPDFKNVPWWQVVSGEAGRVQALAGKVRSWRLALVLAAALLTPPDRLQADETGHRSVPGALAAGIPTLDEMAGDWIPMQDVANPPAVHNFNQLLVVDHDLTSFFCFPGGLYPWKHGYPSVKLAVDGQEFPAAETRCYDYMGVQTMLALERTQFPVSPRSFITSGERADGIEYYWDSSMQATAWALLEPVGMKAALRRWLVQNPRSGQVIRLTQTNGFDPRRLDRITGYAFNACTIFKTADEYLRVTGDRGFLDERLADGKTVLEHMDAFATDWETLPKGPHGLADYGDNGNLLECAPAYVHFVPSCNAQNIWMMRRAAAWHALHGETARVRELQEQSAACLPAVLGLYQSGTGVWNAYHTDGTLVELRHCVDYIYCGNALQNDLTAAQKTEMNAFVKRELFMRDWMRAMSLQDAAAAHSDRPDHGPMGAYDGWIPLTVGTMWRLGDRAAACEFYRRTAVVTREGPFAQAREFYGPDKTKYDAPVRVARRLGCMKECISGVAFTDVVINTFFGFSPSPDGNSLVSDPQTPRPFQGTLAALRYRGRLYQITASGRNAQIRETGGFNDVNHF